MKHKRMKRLFSVFTLVAVLGNSIPVSVFGGQSEETQQVPAVELTYTDGAASNNSISGAEDKRYGELEYAYMEHWGDGGWSRVEYLPKDNETADGTGRTDVLIVENYDSNYVLQEQKTVDFRICTGKLDSASRMNAAMFGGLFLGESNNYVVIGWNNLTKDDTAEVLRVIKYSKDWSRQIAHRSFYNINSQRMFDAGSCRMAEKDGFLYIHTSQQMSKGIYARHQANLTIRLNENMETSEDDLISCGTRWELSTYVSHSFDQYVAADEQAVYFADLGDGAPRAVCMQSLYWDANGEVQDYQSDMLEIVGTSGDNDTGVTLMDMEVSDGNVLLLGNTVDQSSYENIEKERERTLFLAIQNATMNDGKLIHIPNVAEGEAPDTIAYLVKGQNPGELYLMWNIAQADSADKTYLVPIDAEGNVIGTRGFDNPYVIYARLSRVKPMMSEAGKIVWYYTQAECPVFVSVDTSRLSELSSYAGIPIHTCDITYTDEFPYEEDAGFPIVASMTYGNYKLQNFRDYEIEYSTRPQVGVNQAVIRGIGAFQGELQKEYTLVPGNPQNVAQIRATVTSVTMTWDAVAEADGYEVSLYQNGTLVTEQKTASANGGISLSNLTAQTNYQYKIRSYTVLGDKTYYSTYAQGEVHTAKSEEEKDYDLANCNIYVSEEVTWEEGTDAIPAVSVYYNQHQLQEGYDYKLEYENHSGIGTGWVIITGIGEFYGTIVRSFGIVPKRQEEEPDSGEDNTEDNIGETSSFLTLTEEMAAGATSVAFQKGDDVTGSKLENVMRLEPGEEMFYRVTPEVSAAYRLTYQNICGYSYVRIYNQERELLYGFDLSSKSEAEDTVALAAGRTYYFRFTNYQEMDVELKWGIHWYPAENLVLEKTSDEERNNAVMPIIYGNLTNGCWKNGQFYFDVVREYYHYDPYVQFRVEGSLDSVDAMYLELFHNADELQAQAVWSAGNTYSVTVSFGNISTRMPVQIWSGGEYIRSRVEVDTYTLNDVRVIKPEESYVAFAYTAEQSGQYQFHLQDTGELLPEADGTPNVIQFAQMYFDEYYNEIGTNVFSHTTDSIDAPTEVYFELEKGRTYYMIVHLAQDAYSVAKAPEEVKAYDWEYSLAVQNGLEAEALSDVFSDYVVPTWVYGDLSSGKYEGNSFVFSDDLIREQLFVREMYSNGTTREIAADDVSLTSNQSQIPWTPETVTVDHQVTVSENGFQKTLQLTLDIDTLVESYLKDYEKIGVLEDVAADVTNRLIEEQDICLILHPQETSEYLLYGSDAKQNANVRPVTATLYDENMQVIAESNQDKTHHYFLIQQELDAGKTYYLRLIQNSCRTIYYLAGMVKLGDCQLKMFNEDYVDTLYYGSEACGFWKNGAYYFSEESVRGLEMPALIGENVYCEIPKDYLEITWPKANGTILPGETVSLSIGFLGQQVSKKVRIADLKEYYCDFNAPVLTIGNNLKREIWYFGNEEYNGCAFFDSNAAGTYTFSASDAQTTTLSIESLTNGTVISTGIGSVSCRLQAGQSCLIRVTPAEGTENVARTIAITQKTDETGNNTDTSNNAGDGTSGNKGNGGTVSDNADNNSNTSGDKNTSVPRRWKVGSAYYTGTLSSGTLTYAGPTKKTVTSVKIPSAVKISGKSYKVTAIANAACKDCKKLTRVTIGSNVKTIGEKAFYNCSALTKITIPSKVTAVKKETFYNCKKLKTVTIGSNVKTIGEKAFYNCSALTKVTIPSKVTMIKKEAFYKCRSLSSVTIKGTRLRTVEKDTLKSTKKKITVTVPKSKYSSYRKLLKSAGLSSPVYKKSK